MTILVDDSPHPKAGRGRGLPPRDGPLEGRLPTSHNIRGALAWLVDGVGGEAMKIALSLVSRPFPSMNPTLSRQAQPGDVLFFHFSGQYA